MSSFDVLVKPRSSGPVALRNKDSSDGRDGARSPIPGTLGEFRFPLANLGFQWAIGGRGDGRFPEV